MSSRFDSTRPTLESATAEVVRLVDDCCDRYEQAWQVESPDLREYLDRAPPECRDTLLAELAAIELHYRRDHEGNPISPGALLEIYPEIADQLRPALANLVADQRSGRADATTVRQVQSPAGRSDVVLASGNASRGLHIRCPHCREPVELIADTPCEEVNCHTCGSTFSLVDQSEYSDTAPCLQAIGRFELVARLGVGGFGTVWKARDTDLDRIIALKIPRKGNLRPDEIDHFYREARAAAQLRHPHIVAVYEIGREDDTVFIVSDYVRGMTLTNWMSEQTLSTREIAEIGLLIAAALEHAHSQGVVHRDLKPSNVMIDEHGQPHLMDFGLAKRQSGEVTMTLDGQILGTAAYMSPEQAGGKAHWTDCRTDLYSLGVILFQMATGELPFRGNHEMHLYRKQTEDAPDLSKFNRHIPRDFSTICLKCLERDPNRRYRSAADVADELHRFLNGQPIRSRPLSRLDRTWRWAKRKPALATALLLTLLVAVAGPTAATVIGIQSEKIQRKNAELFATLAQDQTVLLARGEENRRLQERIEKLLGRVRGVERNAEGWQKKLIEQIVDSRYSDSAGTLTPVDGSDEDRAKFHLGVGFLCAELGRDEPAVAHLQIAQSELRTLLRKHPNSVTLQAALAECLATIAEQTNDRKAAQAAASQELEVRRQLASLDDANLAAWVDLLLAQWRNLGQDELDIRWHERFQNITRTGQQIVESWPVDPAAIYIAACRLTLRRPILSDAAAGPTDRHEP